jgi:adenine-specific DNA-methyltransferase
MESVGTSSKSDLNFVRSSGSSLNYIGSKHKLSSILEEKMRPYLEKYNVKTIADLFSGSGIMSRYFHSKYNVIANEILYFGSIITEAQLIQIADYEKWIERLNKVPPVEGIITKNYSPVGERMFFTEENAKKVDGMRIALEEWKKEKRITNDEYIKLLGTLIHCSDKHANVTSVYGAFLKKWKESAKKELVLKPFYDHLSGGSLAISPKYKVYQKDILELDIHQIEEDTGIKIDAVYLDPPYNQRSYSKNYSPLETIAKYDDHPIKGKTGLREDSGKYSGLFCKKTEVFQAMSNLAKKLKDVPIVFMSYNNEGLLNEKDIRNIFIKEGKCIQCCKMDYGRFASNKNQKRDVQEYLFIIENKDESKEDKEDQNKED